MRLLMAMDLARMPDDFAIRTRMRDAGAVIGLDQISLSRDWGKTPHGQEFHRHARCWWLPLRRRHGVKSTGLLGCLELTSNAGRAPGLL